MTQRGQIRKLCRKCGGIGAAAPKDEGLCGGVRTVNTIGRISPAETGRPRRVDNSSVRQDAVHQTRSC